MADEQDFGDYLTQAMDAAGLSIADLNRLTGISDSVISKWRNGRTIPSVENLRLLAPALGVTTRDLVVRAGHMSPDEVGLKEPPPPPKPPARLATLQDEINARSDLSEADKRLMIGLYERLLAQVEEGVK
jgi:transcriptional regulator with XRE-family HTH domain